jgi:hypothetical protein
MGVGLRHFLVVSGADDAHAALARTQPGLVLSPRSGIVRIPRWTCCVWADCRHYLRRSRPNRIALFIESDPINRQPEAPGSRTVRSIGWGAAAGLVGGLAFLPIITIVTGLSQLAGLVGGTSAVVGVIVHLFISGLIGISYGLLFEHESPVDKMTNQ